MKPNSCKATTPRHQRNLNRDDAREEREGTVLHVKSSRHNQLQIMNVDQIRSDLCTPDRAVVTQMRACAGACVCVCAAAGMEMSACMCGTTARPLALRLCPPHRRRFPQWTSSLSNLNGGLRELSCESLRPTDVSAESPI